MTRFFLILRVAFRAIARNKLRSALTCLGIIIGVGAVIAMVAIGEGASSMVRSQIASLGDNVINIFPGSDYRGGRMMGGGTNSSLTEGDVEALATQLPYLTAVSPVVNTSGQVIFGNQNWSTQVVGVGVDYLTIRRWAVVKGANFNPSAVRSVAKVALIGQTIADQLFQGEDPVGQVIRIKKMPFTVVGVLDKKGMNTWGRDQDDVIIVPYTTAMKRMSGQTYLSMIMASATSAAALPQASEAATELLRTRHRIPPGGTDDFSIRTQADIQNVMGSTAGVMRVLLAVIASVSLVVGGIGIMNIMLVSVTERTREIGVRMAVGAKGWHVLLQFLAESTVLASLGGVLGILLGLLTAELVSRFARWPVLVSPQSVVVAFCFAAAIGIFFGFWPARKASQLDPIEALRYE
ncbi:MAG: ABC transporter permease [Candidatus Eisenbacteria bacterium]|nr:ABC transporter permease [Candidatus Eisenbacteria bacterium]MCC7141119.1 ABC transporter permease [Candidatus Eisenbacteria bacterium]